jgi:hypothetical protein
MVLSTHSTAALAALLLLLLAGGCSSLRVKTDFDPEVDFSAYRTFAWQEPPLREATKDSPLDELVDPFARNSLLDKRVRKMVERELIGRGYRLAVGAPPQFRINYHVVLKDRTRVTSYGGMGGVNCWGRGPCYGDVWGGGVTSYDYQQGTFILDVIDPGSERIAWRGWAVGTGREYDYDEKRIEAAVKQVLARFPPDGSDPPRPGDEET